MNLGSSQISPSRCGRNFCKHKDLNVRGMVRNHKLASSISDVGWGMFVNFLSYKLEREDKRLVEIDRFFPSSHICPDCLTQTPKMDLSIREWICLNQSCGKTHARDEAASRNIRAEGIRIIKTDGTGVSASGGSVRPSRGRKTKVRQHPAKLETPREKLDQLGQSSPDIGLSR